MRTRLPPLAGLSVVMLSPLLEDKVILSWPSAGEVADNVQSSAPPGDTVSESGTEPRLTYELAALVPVGNANTPTGKDTANVADFSPTWLVLVSSCSSLMLIGKPLIVPPGEPVKPDEGILKKTVEGLTVML